jgi:hypothetical protein
MVLKQLAVDGNEDQHHDEGKEDAEPVECHGRIRLIPSIMKKTAIAE